MEKHSELILMGQDIAEYGGAFKVTEGFVEEFGKARVRNTPLCESHNWDRPWFKPGRI
jgi:2-oxoisovalerate dehydrogenase E1 component